MPNDVDINGIAAGFLRDLSAIQTSKEKTYVYKRAAAAVYGLEQPVSQLTDAALLAIPGVGPSSARVIREVIASGTSDIAVRAVAASGQQALVESRRALREGFLSRARARAVLEDESLRGVSLADYRGDFHVHSEWSDGEPSLETLAAACLARGYACMAVTDHSHGLRVARGMSMAEVANQHLEIDRINGAAGAAFRLIKGVEANIDAEGRLDLSDDEADVFELVLAAPHAQLRIEHDQTKRMLTTIANPRVRILAHPRGRQSETRIGIRADWDRVFAAAARAGIAVELDGAPSRQDLDAATASRALAAGCVFSLDSDAHSIAELQYAETAIAQARLADIPASRVVNCWSRDRLLRWIQDRTTAA